MLRPRVCCGARALSNLCLVLFVGSVEVLEGRAARRAPARAHKPHIHLYTALVTPHPKATRSVHSESSRPCRAVPSRWHCSRQRQHDRTSMLESARGSRARTTSTLSRARTTSTLSSFNIHTRSPRIQPPSRYLRPASPANPAQHARPTPSYVHSIHTHE